VQKQAIFFLRCIRFFEQGRHGMINYYSSSRRTRTITIYVLFFRTYYMIYIINVNVHVCKHAVPLYPRKYTRRRMHVARFANSFGNRARLDTLIISFRTTYHSSKRFHSTSNLTAVSFIPPPPHDTRTYIHTYTYVNMHASRRRG